MSVSGWNNNGKSITLKKTSQDYTHLLFSDSESDERVPDLKLPPIKGKKQKRKRNLGLGVRPDDTSGPWNVFKVLLVISILAGITALAAVTFWSLKKITEMEDQIEKFQKSDAATPETITNLQKNVASLNRSIADLKTTTGGIKVDFEAIKKKFEEYESAKTALDQKLNKAKDMLDLPTKVTGLEKTVADMGSDVQQYGERMIEVVNVINDIKPASKVLDEVGLINLTLTQELGTLKQKLNHQETKISVLMTPDSTKSKLDEDSLDNMMSDIVFKIMENRSFSIANQRVNQTDIDTIMKDVKELINSTLTNFSKEFQEIQAHLILIDKILTELQNITVVTEPTSSRPTVSAATSQFTKSSEIQERDAKEQGTSEIYFSP